jgi:phosphate transport system substrate-binding protein
MSIACAMLILPVLCSPVQAQTSIMLVATGSSLPEPLYLLWNEEYHREHAETQLRYLPEGTGESATRILAGAGDLGGGDAPIPEKQLKGAAHPVVELPSVLIGIAIVYNVPGAANLRLSGPVLANIFLGKTTSWNDPEIAKLNPELHLSALPIKVIHRTDGKGSSYIFSDYLAKISADFLTKAGRSVSPKWPVGVGINRTEDLLDKIRKTPGSIGYTELNWAEKSGLPMAHLRNAAGEFIKPSVASIADAASALAGKMTEDFRVSLVNAPGKASYPIASFTWLYVPERAQDPARGQAVAEYLKWVYSAGQELAREHGYAPLPPAVLEKVRAKAAMVR